MTDGRAFHRTFLIAACLWLAGLRAYGQDPVPQTPHISIADHFVDGAKMVATFEGTALEGATAVRTWTLPTGMESESFDAGSRVYLWRGTSALGQHKIACDVTYTIEVLAPDPIDKTKFVTRKLTLPAYHFEALFTVGAAPNPPPGPTPVPVPPTPVVEGKRTVVLIHESQDDSDEFARMAVHLRTGANATYLESKGHTLLIFDDDAKDQNGNPLKLVTDLVVMGSPLPLLAVIDSSTAAVLHTRPLTPEANAAGVMQVLREHGG